MAVPKRKTSKSKRNMRRANHALKLPNVVINATTGEYQLPHRMSIDGYYNGRKVIADAVINSEDDDENES